MRKLFVLLVASMLVAVTARAWTISECSPMSDKDFEIAHKAISEAGFLDDKVAEVDKILEQGCLSSEQLRTLLLLFEFENIKLAVAQRAYPQVSDAENFNNVYEVFEFDDSVARLQEVVSR